MMETIISFRNCDHPLKSGSCLGCNVFRLYEALVKGKLNWAKDEYNGIVESKLEQPTLSPDDLRGVVHCKDCKWSHAGYCEKYDDLIPLGCANKPWEDWFCADGKRREIIKEDQDAD